MTPARDARRDAEDRQQQVRDAERERGIERDKQRVITAMGKYPGGETRNILRTTAGLSGEKFNRALGAAISDGTVMGVEVMKGNHKTPREGYMLADTSGDNE